MRPAAPVSADQPSPRQPCPCGSGRRYKACHGSADPTAATTLVARPFEGLPSEPEWVALREFVSAASFQVRLIGDAAEVAPITVATVLPMAWPAMVRADGARFLGLQTPLRSPDAGRELGAALRRLTTTEPGNAVTLDEVTLDGPRLSELVAPGPVEVTVHDGFDFWLDGVPAADVDAEVRASLERANSAVLPSVRIPGAGAAYWTTGTSKNYLRWVLPYDESSALDALARRYHVDGLDVGEGCRYAGSFRAHGLLVPVWDLDPSVAAEALAEPLVALGAALAEAAADSSPLTTDEAASRRALAGRQLTIR